MPESAESSDGIDRPAVCVDTLEFDGEETHQDPIEGEVTRQYYSCPSCGHPISTWMDCPECLWYDSDVWVRTLHTDTDRTEPSQ
jgi:hypothetical protein